MAYLNPLVVDQTIVNPAVVRFWSESTDPVEVTNMTMFSNAKKVILEASIDFTSAALTVGILKSTWTQDINADVWGDVSAHEIAASGGYTEGGVALAGLAVTEDGTNKEGVFDANDLLIAGVTAPDVQYFILFDNDVTTKTLIGIAKLDAPVAYVAQNIRLNWSANGILRIV